MSDDKIVSLQKYQRDNKANKKDLYERIQAEHLPLYFKVPENKFVFVSSYRYLDLLITHASPDDLKMYDLRGGWSEMESAKDVVWLKLPAASYSTLFSNGCCKLFYCYEGLQPSKTGLREVLPKFEASSTQRFSLASKRTPLPTEMVYFMGQRDELKPSVSHCLIHLDDILIRPADWATRDAPNAVMSVRHSRMSLCFRKT